MPNQEDYNKNAPEAKVDELRTEMANQIATESKALKSDMDARLKDKPDSLKGPQTGLEGDKRTENGPATDNPFRPRYRKLAQNEADHHDAIKDKAFELYQLIQGVPAVRTAASGHTGVDGFVLRDMALAKTALEDVVMRAVRALTA